MNFIKGNEASFLTKLSEDVEEFLQVPTPFAKKYLEKSNNIKKQPKIVLRTKYGVEWKVRYFKIKDEHYFINGWFEFMKDNNLQNGDSLIFFLITSSLPNLIFEVFFYAQNGCSKNTTSSVIRISDNAGSSDGKKHSIEEEASDDDSSKNVESSYILRKVVKKSYIKRMQLSRRFVKAAGIDGYLYLQLENDEGKKWEVDLRKYGREEISHIVGGWSKFVKDNKVKVGNSCDIYHVKDNVLHVHVDKKKGGPFSKKPRTS